MGGRKKNNVKEIQSKKELRSKDRQTKKYLRKKKHSKGDRFKLAPEYVKYFNEF